VAAPSLQGNGEALVRPIAASTCDLDEQVIRGRVPMEPPLTMQITRGTSARALSRAGVVSKLLLGGSQPEPALTITSVTVAP